MQVASNSKLLAWNATTVQSAC